MSSRFSSLFERRVPHYLVMYVGIGWGLVQFISFFERFGISPGWANMALLATLLFMPSVLMFTFNHGRPGKDRWTGLERVAIPLNLVLAILIAGAGRDLGATVTTVEVTDENGVTAERKVAKSEFRRRAALFNFDGVLPDSLQWLRDGATSALGADLAQDLFIDLRPQAVFREKLREAGYADGFNVPLSAKRQISQELHLPYFIAGTVETGLEGRTVRVTVYSTETGKAIRERVSTGHDLLKVVDDLSEQVRQDLDLPTTRPQGVIDLPVAELLSAKPGAFQALTEGSIAASRDDWAGAEKGFLKATTLDSTFALAHYALYQTRLMRGDAQGSTAPLDAAMRHLKRMPERIGFMVKADHYFMKQDMNKAMAVFNMMVELYPDDIAGHMGRAQLQGLRDEKDSAIASLKRVLALDPQQYEQALRIGELQEGKGADEAALATYQAYAKKFATDVSALLPVARVQQRLGRHADARATLDRALLIAPSNVAALVDLAAIDRNTGDFEKSWTGLEEAVRSARTAEDRNRAYEAQRSFHSFRGQNRLALDAGMKEMVAFAEFSPPIQVMMARMNLFGLFVKTGRKAEAQALMKQVQAQLQPPLDQFWRIGQFQMALETRDTTQIIDGTVGLQSLIKAFRFDFLNSKVAMGDGLLQEVRGDWPAALAAYEKALQLDPKQIAYNRDIARAYRNLGKLDDAQRALDAHLKVVPMSAESNIELARVKLLKGDKAGARTAVQNALKTLEPADAGLTSLVEAKKLLAEIGA